MKKLSKEDLIQSAETFCKQESGKYRKELFGVTDGKAVGTFVEHLLQTYLAEHYEMEVGSSANGLDLPSVNTDIKVTSKNNHNPVVLSKTASKRYTDLAIIL